MGANASPNGGTVGTLDAVDVTLSVPIKEMVLKYCVDCWWFDYNKRAGEYSFEGSSLCQGHMIDRRTLVAPRPEPVAEVDA